MILLREEGRPAASHTTASMMVERPDGAEKVWLGAPCYEGQTCCHTHCLQMMSMNIV